MAKADTTVFNGVLYQVPPGGSIEAQAGFTIGGFGEGANLSGGYVFPWMNPTGPGGSTAGPTGSAFQNANWGITYFATGSQGNVSDQNPIGTTVDGTSYIVTGYTPVNNPTPGVKDTALFTPLTAANGIHAIPIADLTKPGIGNGELETSFFYPGIGVTNSTYQVSLGSNQVAVTVAFTGPPNNQADFSNDASPSFLLTGTYTSTVDAVLVGGDNVPFMISGSGTFTTPKLAIGGLVNVTSGTLHGDSVFIDNVTPADFDALIYGGKNYHVGSLGTNLTLTGSSAKLEAPQFVEIGLTANTAASLSLEKGAQAVVGTIAIGMNAKATGNLNLDGATFTATPLSGGALYIGYNGLGNMTVENGSTVAVKGDSGNVVLGTFADASGTLTIKNSTMTVDGQVAVGAANSTGNLLQILQGGKLISGAGGTDPGTFYGVVAGQTGNAFSNSGGTVKIDGAGSSWDIKGSLAVGSGGAGSITVTDGGTLKVEGTTINLGHFQGATGTLTFDKAGGANPTLTFTTAGGQFLVGDGGQGIVTAKGGATLDLTGVQTTLGNGATGNGLFTIGDSSSGTSPAMVKFAKLAIGVNGTGEMDIRGGSTADLTASDGILILGQNASSSGTLLIDGQGSTLNFDGKLVIGQQGSGTLKITNQAAFVLDLASYTSVPGDQTFILGANTGTGNLLVDGMGSKFTADQGSMQVGGLGQGNATITGGATIETKDLTIGGSAMGAVGKVTVGGAEHQPTSNWNVHGSVTIGSIGDGSLNVGAEGTVTLLKDDNGPTVGIIVTEGAGNALKVDGHNAEVVIPDFLFDHSILSVTHGGSVVVLGKETGQNGQTGTVRLTGTTTISGTDSAGNAATLKYGTASVFGGNTTVSDGGQLIGAYITQHVIGEDDFSVDHVYGTMTVTGKGSEWGTPWFDMGQYIPPASTTAPSGNLIISDGGLVDSSTAILGGSADGQTTSTATMTGAESNWKVSSLLISTGGTVNIHGGKLTADSDITVQGGQFNVDGTDSKVEVLSIKISSSAQAMITNGAQIEKLSSLSVTSRSNLTVSGGSTLNFAQDGGIDVTGATLHLDGSSTHLNGVFSLTAGTVDSFSGTTPGSTVQLTGEASLNVSHFVKTYLFGRPDPDPDANPNIGTKIPTTLDVSGGTLTIGTSTVGRAHAVTVNAGGSLAGPFNIVGGLLLSKGGSVRPNDPATITVSGDYEQQAGGVLALAIGGTTPADTDHLVVGGKATLGGYLELDFINGFAPTTGEIFDLLQFATTAGQFDNVIVTGLAPGWKFSLAPTSSTLSLTSDSNAVAMAEFVVSAGPNTVLTGGAQITPGENIHFVGGVLEATSDTQLFNPIILDLNGGTFQADIGTASTLGGVISGPGIFTKNGLGALTLTAANTYTGDTFIQQGSMFVDGSLASPNVFVSFGALLGGNGTLLGNLFNAGTVSPGHSPGHIQVNGNYTQSSTGLLKIEIAGRDLPQHDLLSVGGVATLDGALQLVRLDHFKLKRNEPVTFLTAEGGVNGKFSTVLSDFTSDTILEPTVVYHANSVALEAVQGSFGKFADGWGLSPNQKAVARGLDSLPINHRTNALFDYLDYRQLTKLPGDFDKIVPEELTSMFTIATSLAQVQSQNIQRRTDDIRSGTCGFSASGLAVNGAGPSYSGSFGRTDGIAGPTGQDSKEDVPVADYHEDPKLGVFLSGTGEWVSVGDTDNARGYDLTSGGFTFGVDYKVTSNFAIGVMAGYTGSSADLADRGRVYVNGGKLGLYATLFQNVEEAPAPTMSKDISKDSSKEAPTAGPSIAKGFYADLAINGGYNSYDTRRSALQGEARGDTSGGELNALFGTGYDFKKGGLTFGPTATFNYTYLGTGNYTEHGSLAPLDIHGGKGESLRTAFGFKASYDWKVGSVLIKPEIRAAWQHEYGDAVYSLNSSFANGGGDSFAVSGPKIGRDSALLGAGVAVEFNDRCSAYLYYDGDLGRKNYESTSVTGGFRVAF